MKNKLLPIYLGLLGIGFSSLANLSPPTSAEPIKTQRYIIRWHTNDVLNTKNTDHNISLATAQIQIQTAGGKVIFTLPSLSATVALLTQKQRQQLEQHPAFAEIEADQQRFFIPAELAQSAQSDIGVPEPYGNDMLQVHLVSDAQMNNQKICLIDTGYDIQHEDLSHSSNISGEISNTLNEEIDLGSWSEDSYGHGTHIAGTIAALNNTWGMTGIAPNNQINLHMVKVIHNPNYWSIWSSNIIAAIERCQAVGANIINLSMVGKTTSAAEEETINQAYHAGTLFIAASGNRGNSDYYYPAAYDNVIAVGAIDKNQEPWVYTQTNDQIELVAPGVEVSATLPNNRYGLWDGTSMATPFISGTAALIWSHHPECTHQQIRTILQNTAIDLGADGRDNTYGYGIPQAKSAVDQITEYGCDGTDPSLIAYYPFNGNTLDESGNNRHLSNSGATLTSDRNGNTNSAYFFNGRDVMQSSAFRNYAWGKNFTVSVWFRRTGNWGGYQGIISNGYHTSGSWELRMGRESSGQRLGTTIFHPSTGGSVIASRNVWHHAVMTYNGSQHKLFLDGELKYTRNRSASIAVRNKPLYIGFPAALSEYFYGIIDDIRLYNRGLSDAEVLVLFQAPADSE